MLSFLVASCSHGRIISNSFPKGFPGTFGLSPGPFESQQKEVDATATWSTLKAFPIKPEEQAANTEWLALPMTLPKGTDETAPSASPIQPGQRPIETPNPMVTPAS